MHLQLKNMLKWLPKKLLLPKRRKFMKMLRQLRLELKPSKPDSMLKLKQQKN